MIVCGRMPSQCTLSTDQPVTQWKSLVWRSPGSAATSLQRRRCGLLDEPGDAELERRRVEARERATGRCRCASRRRGPGRTSPSPPGALGTALESNRLTAGATAMPPRPAANVPSSAARPNGSPGARGRRGPFHSSDSTARPAFRYRRAGRSSPQLHESPVRRISPSAVAITTARSPPPSPQRAHRDVGLDPALELLGAAADLDAADAVHLDGVRRAQQPGPHRRARPRR